MKHRSFFSSSLVGLAIYAGKLRMIHIKKTRHHYHIEHLAVAALETGALVEGKINAWASVGDTLTRLVNQWQIHGFPVAIAMPSRLIRAQTIPLPPDLSDAAIEAEIRAYVQRDLPGSDESICIDFAALEPKATDSPKVFFAATRQAYLSRYVQCVEAAGLEVKIVDIDTYALARAACFALSLPLLRDEIIALLYLEAEMASFMVFNSQEILFNQQWESIDPLDLVSQIKRGISMYFAMPSHPTIHRAVFWGENDEIKATFQSCQQDVLITSPCFFSKMHSFNKIDKTNELLIAGGLAVREIPQW